MASYFLSPIGNDTPFYKGGVQASGCKLFTYVAGSTTKQNTYTDNTGNTANANPILLNSEGYPASGGNVISIWLTQGATYKFVLAPSTDTDPPSSPIWTRDNISGIDDVSLSQSEWVSGPAPTYVSATQFTLVGDQTNNFHVGRRVKYTVTAGTGYATITASAFSAVTTVTVDSQGSNAVDSGLSAVSYSLLRADNFTQSLGLDAITRYATAIAAAATLNLNAVGGDHVHISTSTATATITAVTLAQGHQRLVTFDSPQVLTSNASLIIPFGTMTGNTGDSIELRGEPSNVVRQTYRKLIGAESSLVLIDSKTASTSASLDFVTGIGSTYDEYELHLVEIIPATNSVTLELRVSEDGGSTFKAGATDYHIAVSSVNGAGTAATASGAQTALFLNGGTGGNGQRNAATSGLSGVIKFWKPSATTNEKNFDGRTSCEEATTTEYLRSEIGGRYQGTTNAINAIRLLYNSGNIASGVAYLYGVRKA